MVDAGYLHIKRLPKNTAKEIIAFLNNTDEFGNDWAIGMKYIWDTFKGVIPQGNEQVLEQIEILHARINELENKMRQHQQNETKRKMADGSERK